MKQFEKEYREAMPQTIGETDRQFDDHNYTEFLEKWIVKLLAAPAVSKSVSLEGRELLLAFIRWIKSNDRYLVDGDTSIIDDFLSQP